MIYLLRHGETEWNREGRIQGRTESQLTPLGLRQAEAMADLLADLIERDPPAPWRLVASPLERTRLTAKVVAERLNLRVELDERLIEIGCGAWEGLTRDEVARQHPAVFATREWFFGAPGGERYEEVWSRVAGWLAEQPPETDRHAIVVSHGVAGRLLRGAYGGLSREDTLQQDVPQDAIFRLTQGNIHRLDCEPLEAD